MTKGELIERLTEYKGINLRRAELAVQTIFKSIAKALQENERVEIRGFGAFEVRNYNPYQGRNPKTGESVQVKAKQAPFFRTGKLLRERLNNSTAPLQEEDDE